jgi:hypothetical protein
MSGSQGVKGSNPFSSTGERNAGTLAAAGFRRVWSDSTSWLGGRLLGQSPRVVRGKSVSRRWGEVARHGVVSFPAGPLGLHAELDVYCNAP